MAKKPSVDVKEQAALGAEVPPQRDITREVFGLIRQSADVLLERGVKRGAIIVIGQFASIGSVKGARARPPNPFEGLYLSAADKAFQRMLLQDKALDDGAVVVDTSGQVLGGRIFLLVDHPDVEIPEGCFARHIAAASTSLRKDVESVITLSEEKNIARIFRDGKVVEVYDPATPQEPEKPARKTRKTKKKSDRKRKTATAAKKRTTAKVAKESEEKPAGAPAETAEEAAAGTTEGASE